MCAAKRVSGFSRIVQVLKTSTSASSCDGRLAEPELLEHALDPLGVVGVHLAAERRDVVAAHRPTGYRPRPHASPVGIRRDRRPRRPRRCGVLGDRDDRRRACSRLVGAWAALAWVMLVALVVAAPLTAAAGLPRRDRRRRGRLARARGRRQRRRTPPRLRGDADRTGLDHGADHVDRGRDRRGCSRSSPAQSLRASSAVLLAAVVAGVVLASLAHSSTGAHPPRATLARRRRGDALRRRPLRHGTRQPVVAARVGAPAAAARRSRRGDAAAARPRPSPHRPGEHFPSSSSRVCARSPGSRRMPSAHATRSRSQPSSPRNSPP